MISGRLGRTVLAGGVLLAAAGAIGAGCHSSKAKPDGGMTTGEGGATGRDASETPDANTSKTGMGGATAGAGGATTGAGGATSGAGGATVTVGDSVLMHHRNASRDGVYVQPALTKAAAAGLALDTSFNPKLSGQVYAQPLFVDGNGGTDLVIVATQSDTVYAFDASSGRQVWMTPLGTPVPLAKMPCGNIDPYGVTGTPVIDLASRTLFVAAMVSPDGGATKQYQVFALSLDDGTVKPGWPIDMAARVTSGGTPFQATAQSQRGALAVVNGVLYVPFGGLYGDCGSYHGWLVAIPLANPAAPQAWATAAARGGVWGPSGVASDGESVFITTGNTTGTVTWGGGEAIVSFPTSLPLSTSPAYWAPPGWHDLDDHDTDLGGTGPIVFDLAGAVPSRLAIAFGKDGYVYLEDARNLPSAAGMPLAMTSATSNEIITAAAVYTTATATYAAFKGNGTACTGTAGDLTTVKIVPGSPPTLAPSWCATVGGSGSPMVTTTDGHADAIVWSVGADGNGLLRGFDGDTGAVIFDGGGMKMNGTRRFNTPIAAKGRIFVAADYGVYAFKP
jgi:hypothetical protein